MSDGLKKHFDLDRIAGKTIEIQGEVQPSELTRLRGFLPVAGDPLTVALTLQAGATGRTKVAGRIHGQLQLECQRCLEPMPLTVDRQISLLVTPDDIDQETLPDGYEVFLAQDNRVSGLELVEEELILALPLAPSHNNEQDCGPLLEKIRDSESSATETADEERDAVRPFEVLKALKTKLD